MEFLERNHLGKGQMKAGIICKRLKISRKGTGLYRGNLSVPLALHAVVVSSTGYPVLVKFGSAGFCKLNRKEAEKAKMWKYDTPFNFTHLLPVIRGDFESSIATISTSNPYLDVCAIFCFLSFPL